LKALKVFAVCLQALQAAHTLQALKIFDECLQTLQGLRWLQTLQAFKVFAEYLPLN
jgi:hypothetical protein